MAAEFSALLKSYGLSFAYADEYGKEWTKGAFTRHDTELRSSPYFKNEIYLNFLPSLNSGKAKLLDLPRLRQQLLSLERTTSCGTGRDTVNHPNAGHDDLINAAAGALVMAERLSHVAPIGAVAVPLGNSSSWLPSNRDLLGYHSGEF